MFQEIYLDVCCRPDVAVAAEEHKREMERKQREVLGDADSEWTCPLCIEPMDDTDISFLPCPCGYQVISNSEESIFRFALILGFVDLSIMLSQDRKERDGNLSSLSSRI